MIVSFADLSEYQGLVSLVDGAFDPLHAGHIVYFQAARSLGHPLLCNIASDTYVQTKHPLLLPDWQRAFIVDALRVITYTHSSIHNTEDVLEQLRPYAYIKGKDWEGRLPRQQVEICHDLGIRMHFVNTVIESSSRLLQSRSERLRLPRNDSSF